MRSDDFEHFSTRQRQLWLELVMFRRVSASLKAMLGNGYRALELKERERVDGGVGVCCCARER